MSNVLIINAMKEFAHSKGALNLTLTNVAAEFLQENGHQVKITTVDQGYDIESEIENYLWADTVIYQMPGWWMGEPWILKNTLMKSLPMVMANCTKVMAVLAPMPLRAMVLAV